MARTRIALATAGLTAVTVAASMTAAQADERAVPGTAGATTVSGVVEPARPAFYDVPTSIPATPGTIIRQEVATTVLDPLGVSSLLNDARRIMYSSSDRDGNPIAVTGVVISPRAPYLAAARRPLVAYAPGTQGMADKCAPSRQMQQMSEYEQTFINNLLRLGYTVAVTDYQGLGTAGTHTYMARENQAKAVLDIVRAAERAGFKGTDELSPVGLSGYSQGGGAVAAAAELAPSYAPQIRLRGVAAGAPPADLAAVGKNLDGGLFNGLALYAAAGLMAAYHIAPSTVLNDDGKAALKKLEGGCVTSVFDVAFQPTSRLTVDGARVSDWLGRPPMAQVVADNRIGTHAPRVPVLISHSTLDDTIPFSVGKQLAKDWCSAGGMVQLRPNTVPTHLGGLLPFSIDSVQWLRDRFAGKTPASVCTGL